MLQKIVNVLGGDPNKREITRLARLVEQINALEPNYEKLTDAGLREKTTEFKARVAEGESLDDILLEAFAAVREASKRTTGMRPFDVQLIGGMVLHEGKIAEMRTGEGKTLVATLPVYLNALTGRGVHLVTVNDYLARRDARWMAPIYQMMGLSVGVLQMAARTENGKKAFIVDLTKESPFEDQNQLRLVDRAEAYRADVTYGTNSEFGFDYLRDNLTNRLAERSQRGHYFAIVDEVDNILIDEARTPLIISGPAADDSEWYVRMAQIVRALKPEDYEINERDRTVTLTEAGLAHVEELLDMALGDPDRPEDIQPEQARVLGHLEQALKGHFLFKRNKDYIVQSGKVVIVDEFTGRLMPGRRWSEGLHQAVEAKEGVKVEAENVTYATITIQNYFRMYEKLAGMTGTALTEAEEFAKIYKLEVLPIPTNLEYSVIRPDQPTLLEVTDKDAQGYKTTYYTRRDDPLKAPVFWKRQDFPDIIYRSEEAKLRAITLEITHFHVRGRPQLVGTTSVEHSERLSDRLQPELLRRLMQAALIRDAWLKKNNRQEGEIAIPELQFLYKPLPELNTGELRQVARSVGMVSVNPEDPGNLERLLPLLDLNNEESPRLVKVLQGGVPHQVLNARKHDEESQIIAKAGAFGAVTIATNMAGRGVDIKLGGELEDEVYNDIIRTLRRAGLDPYEMNNEARRQALLGMTEEQYSIYGEAVQRFLQYMDEMEKVRELGGLHVIGSERHEARRIDNQLRGRSSRQGDPGSSRFYLSLEDDLMRLFGGQQVEGLLQRLKIDESIPIENNVVARLVENSQTRVEGTNFDIRKHLLEYDDVLNMQRKRIYDLRDRTFTKEDLSEDVGEMLRTEVRERVSAALSDPEGGWKLLAHLEEIQSGINIEGAVYPSFTFRLMIDELKRRTGGETIGWVELRGALVDLAREALEAERSHLVKAIEQLLERAEESFKQQLQDRLDVVDNFFQTLEDRVEEAEGKIRAQELADELSALARLQLRFNGEELRNLLEGGDQTRGVVRDHIEAELRNIALYRVIAAIQRRVEDFDLRLTQLPSQEWDDISNWILDEVERVLNERIDRLAGPEGQIKQDLEEYQIKQADTGTKIDLDQDQASLLALLSVMMQGTRLTFDRKTHQRGRERVIRLTYFYYAAGLLQESDPEELTNQIIEHLEGASRISQLVLGRIDISRMGQTATTIAQLDVSIQQKLRETLGEEKFSSLNEKPVQEFTPDEVSLVTNALGKRLQNEFYRDVILGVISQLWVDYLTRVDSLRVSIGLEAYGQRDPLVQYKSQASEMFQTLLAEIRSGVVTRMFAIRGIRSASAAIDRERTDAKPSSPTGPTPPTVQTAVNRDTPTDTRSARKKKRHRH